MLTIVKVEGSDAYTVTCPVSIGGFNFLKFEVSGKTEVDAIKNLEQALTAALSQAESYVAPTDANTETVETPVFAGEDKRVATTPRRSGVERRVSTDAFAGTEQRVAASDRRTATEERRVAVPTVA